jgi:hypothetical protein
MTAQFKTCIHNAVDHSEEVVVERMRAQDATQRGNVKCRGTRQIAGDVGQGCCGVSGVRSGSSARIRS